MVRSRPFVAGLAERAHEAEELRRLPSATVDDFVASDFAELLVPARYGGVQALWSSILDPVRRMAHGCASSAWTLGFYALHNWMMAAGSVRCERPLRAQPAVADQTRPRRAGRSRGDSTTTPAANWRAR